MSKFALMVYDTSLFGTWDSVVNKSKNGNFLHLRNYMDYHAHRFDERSVIVEKNAKPVAIFPCNRLGNQVVSHGGLTYGGLIYGNDLHTIEILEIFGMLMQHYKQMGASTLVYKAIPHIFHRYPAEEDLYALFRSGAQLVRRDISSVIPLKEKLKYSDSRKNTIRKAEKQRVVVQEGDFLTEYHALLSSVLEKFESQPVHSLLELQLLKNRFPENIRVFCAFKDERLLGGAIMYDFGHVAHTQYLATSEEGKEIGALDYTLAYLLDGPFSSHKYFSFGISTEKNGMHLNEGLIFQKEGFGGRGVVHDFYEMRL
ncbi:GNAT family N-acetyltransferase [Ferrovum myxofaciens]|uniref:GNAT family N-acetyltransferase n=1 Tax=Ferrovum myxofaciens TaxID=416213 RepID=UPI003EB7A2D2